MLLPETAVLLINVGTPDSPSVKDVRKYLFEFLNDRRVIDIPWLFQKILVNLIIVPFRAPESAKLYRLLWSDKGSPLLYYGNSVKEKLQALPDKNYEVFLAMRYGNPNLKEALEKIKARGYSKIVVLPLYPQYASSTTGTAMAMVMDLVKKWEVIPEIQLINQFYDNPGFINAWVKKIRSCNDMEYDHIVFSYHGLPLRHLKSIHPGIDSSTCSCNVQIPGHGKYCYKATCYETTRLLVSELGLKRGDYSVSFQSRLSDKWMKPFTDELLVCKAQEGVKKILIAAPAFVADCLETTVELGIEYKELFIKSGGSHLEYTGSLNDMPEWIRALKNIISVCPGTNFIDGF